MSQLYRTLTGQSQRSHDSERSGHPVPALTRSMTTTDALTGTLHHLSEDQIRKFGQFKQKLQQDGWWTPTGVNGKPSHDDATLLRYLRARKFDINGACGQFTDTEKWMKEQRVEELYEHFDVDIYERARLLYPQWTGRRDRRGIPLYVFVIKGLDSKHVAKYQKESQAYKEKLPNHKHLSTPAKMLPLFALYHNLLNFVLPMVSTLERPNPEIPVTNATNIVDISGVGLTQFWNLKTHMQDASVLATAHYPETLDRIFIIGAPSFFPTVWGWIKRWFDPVTVSKIFILSKSEAKAALVKFIEPENIPKRYGGGLDWDWGMTPHLDEEARQAVERDGREHWIKGPCLWLDRQRIVVGSEGGKSRSADINVDAKKPVVYAADYTDEPVHPERGGTNATTGKFTAANGVVDSPSSPTSSHPGAVAAATGAAAATAVAASKTGNEASVHKDTAATPPPPPYTSNEPSTDVPERPAESRDIVESSPAALPQPQTAQTAPSKSTNIDPSTSATTKSALPPTVAMPQPGPPDKHTLAINQTILNKLADESVSTIPASANGTLDHPELITASDTSKGLAVDAKALNFKQGGLHEKAGLIASGSERPVLDRFVTAAEF